MRAWGGIQQVSCLNLQNKRRHRALTQPVCFQQQTSGLLDLCVLHLSAGRPSVGHQKVPEGPDPVRSSRKRSTQRREGKSFNITTFTKQQKTNKQQEVQLYHQVQTESAAAGALKREKLKQSSHVLGSNLSLFTVNNNNNNNSTFILKPKLLI